MRRRDFKDTNETYPLPSIFYAQYSFLYKVGAVIANLFFLVFWIMTIETLWWDNSTPMSTKVFVYSIGLAMTSALIVSDINLVSVLQKKQYLEITNSHLKHKNRSNKEVTISWDEIRSYEVVYTGRTRFLRIEVYGSYVTIKIGLLYMYSHISEQKLLNTLEKMCNKGKSNC